MALVIRLQHLALPGELRIEQIDDRTVFDKHRLEQQQWLGQHVDAAPIADVIEVGKLLLIRYRRDQSFQLQPLAGKVVTEPTRPSIVHHPLDLPAKRFGIAQFSRLGKIKQRVIGDAAPEEPGQSRGQFKVAHALTPPSLVFRDLPVRRFVKVEEVRHSQDSAHHCPHRGLK